jgi:exodeoxyribonuclease V gamma subunit
VTFVLHRAERADVLADALADILIEAPEDAFTPEVISVHSRGVERWLSHRLAARLGTSWNRTDGISANLQFPFPGRLVGDALARATGVERETDPWRPERLAWPLLDVVDANTGEPWLQVLTAHLGGVDPMAVDRDRRFAAVRHLGDLFDRYAVHRPAMVRAWMAGKDEDGDGEPLPADMAWQAELWRRVRAVLDMPSPAERLSEGCAALIEDPALADLPSRISLFGLTRLPASYLDVLRALATHRDVHMLALQPSPTGWDRIVAAAGAPASAAANAVRHPLLRAWGRDSREMALVITARLADDPSAVGVHHPLPVVPSVATEAPTLLHRLQAAIRADEPPPGNRDDSGRPILADTDRSVQLHACHGRTREAEVLREAIGHLLADDPTLEPRDIVVMCPDIDEFAPLLHAAFGADPGGQIADAPDPGLPVIPYRMADRSLRQTNPVLGAASELLALVDTRVTVSQVLAFAALAPVRTRFFLSDDDLERMTAWIESTGIRWGLDAGHRARYDLDRVHAGTWDVGLVRLLLGVTMSEDEVRLFGGALPLDDVDSGDIALAGRFAELLARLGHVVRDLSAPRPIGEWAAAIDRAADLLLATRPFDAWQRIQLDRILDEVLDESAGAANDAPLRLAEVRDLLADRLRGQPTRAAFRTGELTMCTLVPMRSVPHRVVCIAGLDDGSFPRAGTPDGDDLIARSRQVGDHDRRSEDRQLLLDAVLAATDCLVITYSGRDPRTNEPLPPAVPVNELLDVIDATVRTGPGGPARGNVVQYHPLQPSDRRCFVDDELGRPGPWGFDPSLLAGARAAAGSRRAPGPFLAHPLPAMSEDHILLEDLVAFVQHPTRAFLRQRLGLNLRTNDNTPRDALSIELGNLEAWGVGDRLLSAILAGADVDAVCAAEVARGLLPPGALGHEALQPVREKAEAIAAAARSVIDGRRSSVGVDIMLADGRRLVGTVPDVVGDVVRAVTYSRIGANRRIAAWVRFLAATAAHPDRPMGSATVGWGRKAPATVRLGPLAPDADSRAAAALELLSIVIDLRDRGMRAPLPMFCATSYEYAHAVCEGDPFPQEQAERSWTSEFNWDKEDKNPEHVLVLGGIRTFEDLLTERPTPDEDGPGWATTEPSRFGRLARRLWDPVFAGVTRAPA